MKRKLKLTSQGGKATSSRLPEGMIQAMPKGASLSSHPGKQRYFTRRADAQARTRDRLVGTPGQVLPFFFT